MNFCTILHGVLAQQTPVLNTLFRVCHRNERQNVSLHGLALESSTNFRENIKTEAAGSPGALISSFQITRCNKAKRQLCDII